MTDKKILRALFLRHYNEMLRLARTLLYDDMEAEDTVQDVFLKLGQSDILSLTPDPSPRRGENGETTPPAPRGQLEEGYKMKAYLMTAVRNGCINRIRQMSFADRFRKLYPLEFNDDWQLGEQRMQTLDAIRDYAETHLGEPHLSIFRLRFEEDLKHHEGMRREELRDSTAVNNWF